MIEVDFLGTTCMVPTKDRNHQGIFIRYKNEGILVDCGEGIQRQFKVAGIKMTKITKILITHWHGDHVLGLPGLIQSLGMSDYTGKLQIYGPEGIKKKIEAIVDIFVNDIRIDFEIVEIIKKGNFIENNNFIIEAYNLDHGTPCLGYRFIEKDIRRIKKSFLKKMNIPEGPHLSKLHEGKSIVYNGKKIDVDSATYLVDGKKIGIISDTVYCDSCLDIADDADLLISESSFLSKHEDKAYEYKHLTAKQAAQIASQSGVKKLVLIHFSPRYKDLKEIEEEAKEIFPETILGYDFLKIKV